MTTQDSTLVYPSTGTANPPDGIRSSREETRIGLGSRIKESVSSQVFPGLFLNLRGSLPLEWSDIPKVGRGHVRETCLYPEDGEGLVGSDRTHPRSLVGRFKGSVETTDQGISKGNRQGRRRLTQEIYGRPGTSKRPVYRVPS